jgi:hypothetical protein
VGFYFSIPIMPGIRYGKRPGRAPRRGELGGCFALLLAMLIIGIIMSIIATIVQVVIVLAHIWYVTVPILALGALVWAWKIDQRRIDKEQADLPTSSTRDCPGKPLSNPQKEEKTQ